MQSNKLYLGLDVHKDPVTITIAEAGPKGEIRPFGTITNDLHALEKALARIRKAHLGAHLEVAYEAAPAGSASPDASNNSSCPAWWPLPPSFPTPR